MKELLNQCLSKGDKGRVEQNKQQCVMPEEEASNQCPSKGKLGFVHQAALRNMQITSILV